MELQVTVELAVFRMTWVSLQMVILTVHQRERTLFHTGGGFHGGVTDVSAASQTFLFFLYLFPGVPRLAADLQPPLVRCGRLQVPQRGPAEAPC